MALRSNRHCDPVLLRGFGLLRGACHRAAPRADPVARNDVIPHRAQLGGHRMKLTFSPASPFARKVRIAAIELGLIDRIEFVPTTVVPGQPNDEYSNMYPLKQLPVLVLDNGDVIVDSYVIVEYLDEL